ASLTDQLASMQGAVAELAQICLSLPTRPKAEANGSHEDLATKVSSAVTNGYLEAFGRFSPRRGLRFAFPKLQPRPLMTADPLSQIFEQLSKHNPEIRNLAEC